MKYLLALLLVVACGGDKKPEPVPPPSPETSFRVELGKIRVDGVMKPGHESKLTDLKARVETAVRILEQ